MTLIPDPSRRLVATAVASTALLLLVGCSSPPSAPTVDDSLKRPLNNAREIQLQACRSELSATSIALKEVSEQRSRETARAPAQVAPAMPTPVAPSTPAPAPSTAPASKVFVVWFRAGELDFQPPADRSSELRDALRASSFVVVRGSTDSYTDVSREVDAARRRAESAARFVVSAGVAPENVRVSWHTAGGVGPRDAEGRMGRKVELELYPLPPQRELLGPAGPI